LSKHILKGELTDLLTCSHPPLRLQAGWYLCGAVFAVVLWRTDWGDEARKAVAVQQRHKLQLDATQQQVDV
jgi:hypothetical protein